jgi:hypothetical protein
MRSVLLAFLVIASPGPQHLLSAPQANAFQNLILSLANSSWVGARVDRAKGNSPAQLKIVQQKDNLTALLTCDGVEETLAITVSAPATIQLKGISFKDLQYSGRDVPLDFPLDSLTAELSPDGRGISCSGVDSQGTHSRFEFRRVGSR